MATNDILTEKVLDEVIKCGWVVKWSHPDALEVGSSTELEVPGEGILGQTTGPYPVTLHFSGFYGYVRIILTTNLKTAEWHGLRPGLIRILRNFPDVEFMPNHPLLALCPTQKTLYQAEAVIDCVNRLVQAADRVTWAVKRALEAVDRLSYDNPAVW